MSQYPDMTVHLCPGRRFRGLESPASHNSSCRGEGCQEVDKSFLQRNLTTLMEDPRKNYILGFVPTNPPFGKKKKK